jgi:hypothetical protein
MSYRDRLDKIFQERAPKKIEKPKKEIKKEAKKNDVTVIGDINVDLLTTPLEDYPPHDSQITIPSYNLKIGGSTANFAVALSRLGSSVRFIGKLGNDMYGSFVEN